MSTASELTRNQRLVLDALSAAEAPLSAYAILDQLRGDGFRAPLQVYRALEKLRDYGLIHRLESINAFVACAHPGCGHHTVTAFAICDGCGQVEEFADRTVQDRLSGWCGQNGFRPSRTAIEIRGTCARCLAA